MSRGRSECMEYQEAMDNLENAFKIAFDAFSKEYGCNIGDIELFAHDEKFTIIKSGQWGKMYTDGYSGSFY